MDRWIRHSLEHLFADKITVVNATSPKDVRALIDLMRPVAISVALKRFGPAGDGGYLMPDDLSGVAGCVSPGVSTECGFDEAMAARGIDVHMADASAPGPPVPNPRFHFTPKFLDVLASERTTTLEELCAATGAGDLVLQMDIEGAEYRVLMSVSPETLQRFRIMVIEFHDLDVMFTRFGCTILRGLFEKLEASHRVVHIHPNNCTSAVSRYGLDVPPVLEFTFYRKDRVNDAKDAALTFPHALDAPCVPGRPDATLPRCWW